MQDRNLSACVLVNQRGVLVVFHLLISLSSHLISCDVTYSHEARINVKMI